MWVIQVCCFCFSLHVCDVGEGDERVVWSIRGLGCDSRHFEEMEEDLERDEQRNGLNAHERLLEGLKMSRKSNLPELDVKVVVRQRAMLDQLGRVIYENRLALTEKKGETPSSGSALRLFLLRPIKPDQERPIMPSLDKQYQARFVEPVRNRNFDWKNFIWGTEHDNKPCQVAAPERKQKKVYIDGVLMSKIIILKRGLIVNGFAVVAHVFGMGIAGKVFVKPQRAPRHLRVELYVPRLVQTFSCRLNLEDLESLFSFTSLLKIGRKKELCKEILSMLDLDVEKGTLKINPVLALNANSKEAIGAQLRQRREIQQNLQAISQELMKNDKLKRKGIEKKNKKKKTKIVREVVEEKKACNPRLRLASLVKRFLDGEVSMIASVFDVLKQDNAWRVNLYHPESCQSFEMFVNLREVRKWIDDATSPQTWSIDKKSQNAQHLLHFVSLGKSGSTMFVEIKGCQGFSGPALVLKKKSKQKKSRKAVILRRARTERTLMRATSRREIGNGKSLKRFLCAISSQQCIVSFYCRHNEFLWKIYNLRTCETHSLSLDPQDAQEVCKSRGSTKGELSPTDLCEMVVNRLSFDWRGKTCFDREIYRHGHAIRIFNEEAQSLFCIFRGIKELQNLKLEVFEISTCAKRFLCFDEAEGAELLKEFASMSFLEREIYLSTFVATLRVKFAEDGTWEILRS